jgi:hypothetical protein
MAVYVNQLRGQGRFLLGRTAAPPPLFALTADAEDELHDFAARLGLRRDPGTVAGSQQPATRHYTLTQGEHDRAVELGAQVITAREADKMERQRAAMRGERRP